MLEHYEQGIPLHRQAVLFRAASHSTSLELALARHNIPFYKYGGLRFLETAHIKDLISILRMAENPRDEIAWFRILQLLSGVGPVTAASAFEHVRDNGYNPASIATFRAPSAATDEVAELGLLMGDLVAMHDDMPSLQIERVRRFYGPVLERSYENIEPRINEIEHLGQMATRYTSRRQFLSDLILDPPISTGDFAGPPSRDEDWLVLSTIHSAKGLEWDVVFLIHAADGCLPSDMSTGSEEEIEEELRLTYVAMTRARDFLYVLWPLRYYQKARKLSDNHAYAQCCRFFTADVVETMEKVGAGTSDKDNMDILENAGLKHIGARIRNMWR